MAPDALQRLATYDWPGNVRELKNVAERLVVGSRAGRIESNSLPSDMSDTGTWPLNSGSPWVASSSADNQHRFERLMKDRVSFWSEVHEPFMNHDLTQGRCAGTRPGGPGAHARQLQDARQSVQHGPPRDYKRFLSFLRTYECHVSFRPFRMMADCSDEASQPLACA